MQIILDVLISAATSLLVTRWAAKRCFDMIDRYVAETTAELSKAADILNGAATIKTTTPYKNFWEQGVMAGEMRS